MYMKDNKYIFEVEDVVRVEYDGTGNPSTVLYLSKEGLWHRINYSDTNIKFDSVNREEVRYKKGLDDAWEAARKIINEIPVSDIISVFGENSFDVLNDFSPKEAMAKIKAYEDKLKAKKDFKVGDEVRNGEYLGVVTRIHNTALYITYADGSCDEFKTDSCEWKKTGRHFPQIAEVLKEMKEGEKCQN